MVDTEAPYRARSFQATGKATLRSFSREVSQETLQNGARAGSSSECEAWCAFSELSFAFPLKLINPRQSSEDAIKRARAYRQAQVVHSQTADVKGKSRALDGDIKPVGVLYIVGYGGGLVSGDDVTIDFDVGSGSTLLALTQGSTKVFKVRRKLTQSRDGQNLEGSPSFPPQPHPPDPDSRQYFRVIVREGATLALLPDPVTCYEDARYEQVQRIDCRCARTSSLALLDWYTSGRTLFAHQNRPAHQNGAVNTSELWGFDRYKSRNEIRVAGQVIVRDSLLLARDAQEEAQATAPGVPRVSQLARRNAPYGCYGTLFLLGPDFQELIDALAAQYHLVQQLVLKRGPPDLLWSFSILREDRFEQPPAEPPGSSGTRVLRTAVLRVAGTDAEAVRAWLRGMLVQMQAVVGDDLYKQAFGTA